MNDIYIYNFDFFTKGKIQIVSKQLGITIHEIEISQYDLPIYVLINNDKSKSENKQTIKEPMMLIHLSNERLDELLALMKQNNLNIKLKAIVTQYNMFYTSLQLYEALSLESRSING